MRLLPIVVIGSIRFSIRDKCLPIPNGNREQRNSNTSKLSVSGSALLNSGRYPRFMLCVLGILGCRVTSGFASGELILIHSRKIWVRISIHQSRYEAKSIHDSSKMDERTVLLQWSVTSRIRGCIIAHEGVITTRDAPSRISDFSWG